MNHKPVCVPCGKEFRPHNNDGAVLDYADFGPFRLWLCDIWKCPGCGHEIAVGFGQGPILRHNEEEFSNRLEKFRKSYAVVDMKG